ncbi:hypothetical protein SVAN01_06677 [Stagonosporopsis vannaccii]|nr:hypothetical protein SVAN01_06677 [Stagonosporopsis vannaccii]
MDQMMSHSLEELEEVLADGDPAVVMVLFDVDIVQGCFRAPDIGQCCESTTFLYFIIRNLSNNTAMIALCFFATSMLERALLKLRIQVDHFESELQWSGKRGVASPHHEPHSKLILCTSTAETAHTHPPVSKTSAARAAQVKSYVEAQFEFEVAAIDVRWILTAKDLRIDPDPVQSLFQFFEQLCFFEVELCHSSKAIVYSRSGTVSEQELLGEELGTVTSVWEDYDAEEKEADEGLIVDDLDDGMKDYIWVQNLKGLDGRGD